MTRDKIIITGASSGLGEGMARQFAARGRSLGLAARRVEKLDALAAELADQAGRVVVRGLDVTDFDDVPRAFAELADGLGGVDRVIVNAGLGKGAPIGTGNAAANLETVQTNLLGALAQAEAAMEIFRAQNHGHLVLISSISAVRGLPKAQAAYSASKAGVSALGQGLQTELAGSPITVSVILPGYIETDINRGVKTKLMSETDDGVRAMVAAIEAERRRSEVPAWPWTPIAAALKYLPDALSAKLV
ncbi:SDR family oxidoreductase [Gordonia alkaliphila]|uniref:SDR family oxidoreductase n=1 Tax=Gordonia alkaliphila TaxID=1053547 RepID=UPI0027E31D43|nr:SDR family oxidoreductase [Gordonia alkaliphila]